MKQFLNFYKRMYKSYGIDFKPTLVEVSHKKTRYNKSKLCYNNTFNYVCNNINAIYVLGWTCSLGFPIDHAFIKEDDKYFDITLQTKEGDVYYSLVELTAAELIAFTKKNRNCPLSYHDYLRITDKQRRENEVSAS